MMVSPAVVNRYAGALVDVVLSSKSGIDSAGAVTQLRSFEQVVRDSHDLQLILASPAVSAARKRTVIRRIAEALNLAPCIRNFILVLSDHRRAGALSQMIDSFEVLVDERLGFVPAEVRTAIALNPDEQANLAEELASIAGSKVRTRFTIDSDLIGGAMARLGSTVYDGSVRGQIAAMRRRLALQR